MNIGGATNGAMIDAILLLYHRPVGPFAATIVDHVNAFERHSRFKVVKVNTELGFPPGLENLRFTVVLLHYSLFGKVPYKLNQRFYDYLDGCESSYRVGFFQEEYRYCQELFGFINRYRIDCVYSLMQPSHLKDFYGKYTRESKVVCTLPGYVSTELVRAANNIANADADREIDIGYRARAVPFYLGRRAQEKYDIGNGFLGRAAGLGLKLDISLNERDRLYGRSWYQFLSNSRGLLGAPGGASIFDVEGVVRSKYLKVMREYPDISFKEFEERAAGVLSQWEGRISNMVITPRHFEGVAFRACQILFEDEYSGLMQPMVHYIPLKKDFSNFDEVIRMFNDKALRRELTVNAYGDLIASREYSYETFIRSFDGELAHAGVQPGSGSGSFSKTVWLLNSWQFYRKHRKVLGNLTRPHRRRIRGSIPLR